MQDRKYSSRSLRISTALASGICVIAAIPTGAAAQTIPQGNTAPIVFSSVAPDEPTQTGTNVDGTNAASGADFSIEVLTPSTVKDATVPAAIDVVSKGGRGGDTENSDVGNGPSGPVGGNGGNGGVISLAIDAPTGNSLNPIYTLINPSAAGSFGVRLNSIGGDGGMGSSPLTNGNGGEGGGGGTSGNISFTLPTAPALPGVYTQIFGTAAAILLETTGGDGGEAGSSSWQAVGGSVTGRKGGSGGNAGTIVATVAGMISGFNPDTSGAGSGLVAASTGGDGGPGGGATEELGSATSGGGGNAGNGGDVTIQVAAGTVTARGPKQAGTGTQETFDANSTPGKTVALDTSVTAAAIMAWSQGGTGGIAGEANGASTHGGSGAKGGIGGDVLVSINGDATKAGGNQVIGTTGYNAFGVLAVSAGGDGGDGDSGGGAFYRKGGAGANGGDGGVAWIKVANDTSTPYVKIHTTGDDSDALVAISLGGGGGTSGDLTDGSGGGAIFSLFIGGLGGTGGNSTHAWINNGYYDPPSADGTDAAFHAGDVIITTGTYSRGLVAQTVGGGGGRGGDVTNTSLFSAVTIGGKGGTGGVGGDADVTNFGLISTKGAHSAGIFSQSVGGGGGSGGGALSRVFGQNFAVSVAVGGDGGSGGVADAASAYNIGQVQTAGTNAHAVFVQSVGGGGGLGGTATAEAFVDSVPDEPSIQVTAAIGGKGASGGIGGVVEVVNIGLLQTQGQDAYGVFAQSVGGGGGSGGDASILAMAIHQPKVSVQTTVGGDGGSGGDGGKVSVFNSGLITTDASTSVGVFAQSVGGGGGDGGHGTSDQGAWYGAGSYSVTLTVAVGGKGGASGNGGDVVVNNYISSNSADPGYYSDITRFSNRDITGNGGILTQGDMAPAIFAQSIGGGGGNGGDSSGKGGNGQITMNVAIGGGGGAGGNGGDVTVNNGGGAIKTVGAQSYGIIAQSVGGGGGTGGNAATGSGDDPEYALPKQAINLASGNIAQNPTQFTEVTDDLWDWKDNVKGAWDDVNRLEELYKLNTGISTGPAQKFAGLKGSDLTVDVGGGAGGNGGSGGHGGTVQVSNAGSISTKGAMAYAIFAQSIGGGGGTGGAAAPSTANDQLHDSVIEAAIAVGGSGGSGGNGGNVSVANEAGGNIVTFGDLGMGIFAQSIGGGGGVAGITTPNAGLANPMALSFGGAGADNNSIDGKGGTVYAGNTASIKTSGDHAMGMMVQSVGGGGGMAAIMGAALNTETGLYDSDTQAATTGIVAPTLAQNWTGENDIGGNVTADLGSGGSITTSGVNAFGILAQSIGGGGGLIVVDKNTQVSVNSLAPDSDNYAPANGNNAGIVAVNTQQNTSISTTGDGAAGIVAQSLGGGGAIVNGLKGIDVTTGSAEVYQNRWDMGMGGQVLVTNNSDITTTGAYAHGIFVQVASGTGGFIGRDGGNGAMFRSGFGYAPYCDGPSSDIGVQCGGRAAVELQAGTITVSGANSWGVVVESEYVAYYEVQSGPNYDTSIAEVSIASGARIFAKGNAGGAILLNATGANEVVNSGVIDGSGSAGGYAINSVNKSYKVINNAGGTIAGSFGKHCSGNCTDVSAVSSTIQNNGTILAGSTIDLGSGALTNAGTLHIGNVGKVATTTLTGDLVQLSGGTLYIDADMASGVSDKLNVSGSAKIGGTVRVAASSITNRAVKVLTAAGGVTLDPALAMADSSHLYDFKSTVSGKDLMVSAVANFAKRASTFGANEQAVAGNLQSLFDGGASADKVFGRLMSISDDAGYAAALGEISGRALGSFGSFRFNSSRTFAANLYGGCDDLQFKGRSTDRCGWARAMANSTNQDATTDTLGYDADSWTMQMGGQVPLSESSALTGSIAYENSSFHDGDDRIKGDSLIAGVGLLYTPSRLELSTGIDMAWGWYRSNRTITVGGISERANAKPTQWQIGGHARAAWNLLNGGDTLLRPFVEGHAIRVSNRAFTEDGSSPFRLAVEEQADTALLGVAGMEFATRMALSGRMALRPFASAAVEFGNSRDWTTTARFAEQPQSASFDLTTAGPGTLARFVIGADLIGASNVAFSLQYAPELGSGFTSHTGMARLTVVF